MASSTVDSIMQKAWMKNICARQAEAEICPAPHQRMANSFGTVETEAAKSIAESMHRNRYTGLWRAGSVATTTRMVILPTTVAVPRQHTGSESHRWNCSRPGIPRRKKMEGSRWVWLGDSMVWARALNIFFRQKPSHCIKLPEETTQNRDVNKLRVFSLAI